MVLCGQPWNYQYLKTFKSTEERHLSFREQQMAFNQYWRDKKIKKGKGYTIFKRWEYFAVPRVGNSGAIDNKALWQALTEQSSPQPGDSSLWHYIGPDKTPFKIQSTNLSGNGRLNCIAFNPLDSNILYVGAPSGGLWITRDGGEHWQTSTDYLDAIGISDIVVSHEDTSLIYLATGDADFFDTYAVGILKSTDGGKNWETTNLNMNVAAQLCFSRIIMHPSNANIMLATSSNGIYKTINGWSTYTLVQSGNFRDIKFKPGNPNYIYATSFSNLGNGKIYRSTDGGNTFNEVSSSLAINGKVERIELAVTEDDPNIVMAIAVDVTNSGLYGIFRSTNSGSNWQIIFNNYMENLLGTQIDGSDLGGQGHYDLAMAIDPYDKSNVMVGGVNNWGSIDGGFNWNISSSWAHSSNIDYVHADQHMLAYSPHGNRTLYAVNDGGIYKSYNHGDTWIDITHNMQILQVYRLSSSKQDVNKLICGSQDNGTFLYTNSNWYEIYGGDGMECYIDPYDDKILYYSLYYGKLFKSVDEGLTPKPIMPVASLRGAWITPYQLHPQNSSWIYAAYRDVYKSEDAGESWTKLSEELSTEDLISLVVAPSNDQYIYTSTYNQLFKTKNGGISWSLISYPLPEIPISSIAVSPNDPNKIWVALSGYYPDDKIYYSSNGGVNWSNFSQGLPNVPVNNLVIRFNSNQEIFAATDIGVYYRNADMNTWINYSGNLPNVIVDELEISEPFQKLRAATYGRGIWETDLPPAIPSKADFKANITLGCTDAPIKLAYTGGIAFDSLKWKLSAANILSVSPDNDTITVSFDQTGLYTIKLNHYRNDTLTTEVKYQYLQISTSLDFPISPDRYYACDTSSIKIYLPEGYEYSWDPEISLDSVNTQIIKLKPLLNTTYNLKVKHGDCEVSKEFILFMPDDVCKAIFLPEGNDGIFSNTCAGYSENEPLPGIGSGLNDGCVSQDGWCNGQDQLDNSLWFKLVVPENGKLRVRVSGFDSQIALYKAGTCPDLVQGGNYELIAANDDISSTNYNSEIGLLEDLTPGDTLYLQVDGSLGGTTGEFSVQISDKPTALHYPEQDIQYRVYPNPALNEIWVKLQLQQKSDIRLELISETGNIFSQKSFSGVKGYFNERFDTSALTGFYLMRIVVNDYSFYQKIIIK
jgi:photosystem II stability/assembly factor-like uncharacterized protein